MRGGFPASSLVCDLWRTLGRLHSREVDLGVDADFSGPASWPGNEIGTQRTSAIASEIQEELLAAIPHLRAFALALSGNVDRADDLVQEALARAIANIHQFTPGTSLQAWLFTILRNWMRSEFRKRRYEVEDPDGLLAGRLTVLPSQQGHVDLKDLRSALTKLSLEQRETLLLVGAEGFSYEEAAQITGTNIGTVKSRVNRARRHLARLMGLEGAEEGERDPVFTAAAVTNRSDLSEPGAAQ